MMGESCRCLSNFGGAWWSKTNRTLPPEVEYARDSDRIEASAGDLDLASRARMDNTMLYFLSAESVRG